MAESVVSSAIIEISNLLIQEAQFLGEVPDTVDQLQTELKRIQSFLKDADKRQAESESLRDWVSEIRELAYEAEDVTATFIAEVASRKEKGLLLREVKSYASIFVENANIHKVSEEIDVIIAKIANLTTSLQTYGIKINENGESSSNSRRSQHQQQFRRSTFSFVTEEETVGLTSDTKVLLEQLLGDDDGKHRKVISICGMGGIGKTTLAKKLYHHDKVKSQFDAFAWICVSKTFNTRAVLEKTLIKLTCSSKEKVSQMNTDDVAKELYQLQTEKRCLVILDDIWSQDAWNALKHAFPVEKITGTIIITTRFKPLGLHVDPDCFIHESQALSEEESWELFQTKAFSKRDYQDIISMEELGRDMVKECFGLPLAIIALGGILTTKYSLHEWSLVHNNVSMSLRSAGDKEYSNVEAILALSYSELPYHLKPCLLYLSQFPKDYAIPTRMLFRMWMAEGFVANQSNREETLEDIAEGYLRELIDRCVVLVDEIGSLGRIKSCRLHDLIRELFLSKANEEDFLEIIVAKTENSKARRVIVDLQGKDIGLISFKKKSRVRSLIGRCDLKSSKTSDFKMIRVLYLGACEIPTKWIKEIGKLIHLKYLCIFYCDVVHLPSSLGNLRYLQTFIFVSSANELKISNNIWNFQELRYLRIEWNKENVEMDDEIRLKLGNVKSLQSLKTKGPIYCEDFENLPNLRKLKIASVKNDGESWKLLEGGCLNDIASLRIDLTVNEELKMTMYKDELHKLLVTCGELKKLWLFGKMEMLPKYNQGFAPNLIKLTLSECCLNEDPMPILEKFPKLVVLNLDETYEGEVMVCSSEGFPQLKTLNIDYFTNLVEWIVEEGAMRSLENLRINTCKSLKKVPDGIKFIVTLSELDIYDMPKEFTERVQVIEGVEGEDYYKVRHVPSVNIYDESDDVSDSDEYSEEGNE